MKGVISYMKYDKELVAGKLRRWEKYITRFHLPAWEDIPDFGLYMEQVVILLRQYLDYLPPELKDDKTITATAINNYVRTKIMPEPDKKKYYRIHIAYLIMICTLKQTLSLAMLKRLIPMDITEEELKKIYGSHVRSHSLASKAFVAQAEMLSAKILGHEELTEYAVADTHEMIVFSALYGGVSCLFAEKLLLLEGKNVENGGSIEVEEV